MQALTLNITKQRATSMTSNIGRELKAAFLWASADESQKKALKKQGASTSVDAIIGALDNPATFDLASFQKQETKKNFAEALSRQLASKMSGALSNTFEGILPDPSGKGHESQARTSKGFKKLDVNYSTSRLGLGLGVSIKTINAHDKGSGYAKNLTRVDAELRAEAADYHERQPYAVMVALIFFPIDACNDRSKLVSSFGKAVQTFRSRTGRSAPVDSIMLFERVFIGLYDTAAETFGDLCFFDVANAPPRRGKPENTMSFDELIKAIISTYDSRNNPEFTWADGDALTQEIDEEDDQGESESDED